MWATQVKVWPTRMTACVSLACLHARNMLTAPPRFLHCSQVATASWQPLLRSRRAALRPAAMSDADSHDDDGRKSKASTASAVLKDMPVVIVRDKTCRLCNESCSSANPMLTSEQGEKRPWLHYRKMPDGTKTPEGFYCLICYNVYRHLGYHLEYQSIRHYQKQVSEDSRRHHAFSKAVSKYISMHNADPELHRLRGRKALEALQTAEVETSRGKRLLHPEMEFVELGVLCSAMLFSPKQRLGLRFGVFECKFKARLRKHKLRPK